jgi:hypothetical protein
MIIKREERESERDINGDVASERREKRSEVNLRGGDQQQTNSKSRESTLNIREIHKILYNDGKEKLPETFFNEFL